MIMPEQLGHLKDITINTSNRTELIRGRSQTSLKINESERKLELIIDSKMQIEKYCFLWLTGWSSWIYVLKFVGFMNIFVIQHENSESIHVLNEFYTVNKWTMENLADWIRLNHDADPLFILEGTQVDVNIWLDQIQTLPPNKAFVCLVLKNRARHYQTFKGYNWKRLYHFKDCGGATTSSYQIAVNDHLNLNWRAIGRQEVQWELTDFISMAKGGLDTESSEFTPYLWNPVAFKSMVKVPSVFSNTGWVERKLLPEEMLRLLDIPKVFDDLLLKNDVMVNNSDIFVSILKSVPGKVVLRLLEHIGYSVLESEVVDLAG